MQSTCVAFRVLSDFTDLEKGGEIMEASAEMYVQWVGCHQRSNRGARCTKTGKRGQLRKQMYIPT